MEVSILSFCSPVFAGCEIDYSVSHQWNNGFTSQAVITNTSTQAINGWRLEWEMRNGQQITGLWNGLHSQDGAAVSVINASYNSNIAPGASRQLDFNATHNGINETPVAFFSTAKRVMGICL